MGGDGGRRRSYRSRLTQTGVNPNRASARTACNNTRSGHEKGTSPRADKLLFFILRRASARQEPAFPLFQTRRLLIIWLLQQSPICSVRRDVENGEQSWAATDAILSGFVRPSSHEVSLGLGISLKPRARELQYRGASAPTRRCRPQHLVAC
jgi:hypothetical protein